MKQKGLIAFYFDRAVTQNIYPDVDALRLPGIPWINNDISAGNGISSDARYLDPDPLSGADRSDRYIMVVQGTYPHWFGQAGNHYFLVCFQASPEQGARQNGADSLELKAAVNGHIERFTVVHIIAVFSIGDSRSASP